MSDPRILAIMGSGETAPAMAKVHRALLERLGEPGAPATLIDTPYLSAHFLRMPDLSM